MVTCFRHGDGSSSSTSSMITALNPLRLVDNPFERRETTIALAVGWETKGELAELAPENPLVEARKWTGGRYLLLP